jgi:Domain of unknown function DUF29
MSDDLYDRDILTWSRHQADLLRRIARGQRVNGVDWEHVVEEIEDVGLSELRVGRTALPSNTGAVRSDHFRPTRRNASRHRCGVVST